MRPLEPHSGQPSTRSETDEPVMMNPALKARQTLRRAVAAGVVLVIIGLGCGGGAAASAADVALGPSVSFSAPVALGMSLGGAPGLAKIDDFSASVGRAPAIVGFSTAWYDGLGGSSDKPLIASRGGVPMVLWGPAKDGVAIPLADIAAGKHDAYLKGLAQAAVWYKKPFLVRFAHEMNLAGSPWATGKNGNTAAGYIAAWRHVVNVFRKAGATNVQWVWSPNVDCAGACPFTQYYPGDAYVDWVALDGYNFGQAHAVRWMSMKEIFQSSYNTMMKLSAKPLMIAETASLDSGGNKAAWITQGFVRDLPASMPQVRALVWWNRNDGRDDYRLNSTTASREAFRAAAASPRYGGLLNR